VQQASNFALEESNVSWLMRFEFVNMFFAKHLAASQSSLKFPLKTRETFAQQFPRVSSQTADAVVARVVANAHFSEDCNRSLLVAFQRLN
jgi:hypothetical protein